MKCKKFSYGLRIICFVVMSSMLFFMASALTYKTLTEQIPLPLAIISWVTAVLVLGATLDMISK